MDAWPTTFPAKVRLVNSIIRRDTKDKAGTEVWLHEVGNIGHAYRYTLNKDDDAASGLLTHRTWAVVYLGDIEAIEEVAESAAMVEPVVEVVDPKDTAIKNLREQINRAAAAHQDDIERISKELNEQAEERGWCTDFDAIVSRLNRDLTVLLPVREREYDVKVEQEYLVKITRTIRVTATTEDEALDKAEEMADEYGNSELYDHITEDDSMDGRFQGQSANSVERV